MQYSNLLNPEQLKAVQHKEGPLLVLAGAGSGKTRIVTFRIVNLIESGVDPHQILAVTFTNKAAEEMKQRILQLTKGHRFSQFITLCTFHSLGVRILRESITLLGYKNNFVIYDEDDSEKLLKNCLNYLNIKSSADSKTSQTKIFRNLISQAKNQLVAPENIHSKDYDHEALKLFPEVYHYYQKSLKEYNAVDFDDLLFLTVELFKTYPEAVELYQKRWPYVLIDEYQDTNHAQYMISRYIVGKKQNLFVVGDPDQSIYSWRGANIQNILNFEKDYPGAKIVRLEQNYRSRSTILEAANSLIKNNPNRFEKNLWSNLGPGEKISLYVAENERDEAFFVTNKIEDYAKRNLSLKEIAIFYRTNFQSRVFEDFLLRKRIPYVIVGGISFYQRREIKDILAFLHVICSDLDYISFQRTINLPKRGIGDATVEKIRYHSEKSGLPVLEFCKQLLNDENKEIRLSAKQKEGLKGYLDIIYELKEIDKQGSLQKLVIETIRKTNYLAVLREEKDTYDDRKANLDELVSKAAEWEIFNENASLNDFLTELSLKTTLDEADVSEEKVSLMTMHNGKGLEFSVAFIVGMEEDLFPHANSRDSFEELEEERRLCYVGMTRAKEKLFFTASESRFIWGSFRMMRPSRFLKEIPKDYLEKIRHH